MKEIKVEVYGELGNNAVFRLPERRYPGVLVQGDTLKNLLDTADDVLAQAKLSGNEGLEEEADGLREMFAEIYYAYLAEIGGQPDPSSI